MVLLRIACSVVGDARGGCGFAEVLSTFGWAWMALRCVVEDEGLRFGVEIEWTWRGLELQCFREWAKDVNAGT